MPKALRKFLRAVLPKSVDDVVRLARRRDVPMIIKFIRNSDGRTTVGQRLAIVRRMYKISYAVPCPHTETEVLSYVSTILALPKDRQGVVVEAGCFKGGSTAKFSLAAELAGRDLVVFDSFQGIPPNEEKHDQTIFGEKAGFAEGTYAGALEEVKANVARFGKIDSCRFVKGWFDDTLPSFHEPVAAAYVDVDLASSTRSCLKYLFPLLQPGGVVYSQDGHLPLVLEVLNDDAFWGNEVGCQKPRMVGLGTSKLVKIIKDEGTRT